MVLLTAPSEHYFQDRVEIFNEKFALTKATMGTYPSRGSLRRFVPLPRRDVFILGINKNSCSFLARGKKGLCIKKALWKPMNSEFECDSYM